MDFGKFKYETSKKEKASRKHQTTVVLKEIKLRPKTDEHDFDFKVKHIRRFLGEGNKCKLVIVFRGREIVHPETGQAMLDSVVKAVTDIAMVEQRPMMEGRRMVMIIGPRGGVIRPASPVTGSGPGPAPARVAHPLRRARRPAARRPPAQRRPAPLRPAPLRPAPLHPLQRRRPPRRPPSQPPRRPPPLPPRSPEAKPDSADSAVVSGAMRRPRSLSPAVVLGALAVAATVAGCHRDGCVGGDDGQCVPPAACPALVYAACTEPKLRVEQIGPNDPERVAGPKALAAEGDYLLENDLVRVVLDAPDHPHFIGPSGGAILDLAPLGKSTLSKSTGDQTNAIYHAAGLLPRDAVHYESAAILDPQLDPSAPGAYAAVIFRGHLESDSRITVVTRYELRPCEPGVRVRSDLYNGAPDPNTLYLADAFFWGDNGLVPFVPGPGLGFTEPDLDLEHVDQAWRQWPFLAARSQAAPDTAYAAITCDRSLSAGFNESALTASGVPLEVTQPGDGFHFERFILAEVGPGLAPAVAEALHVRTLVHGDPPAVTVSGRVVANGAPVNPRSGSAASLLFYEPAAGPNVDDPARITPWNEVVPASNGTFEVALPPDRSYRVQPYAFGLPAGPAASFAVASADVSIGDVTITASASLTVKVESSPGVPVNYAEVVLIPYEDPATTGAPLPSLYSLFPGCAPMLGRRMARRPLATARSSPKGASLWPSRPDTTSSMPRAGRSPASIASRSPSLQEPPRRSRCRSNRWPHRSCRPASSRATSTSTAGPASTLRSPTSIGWSAFSPPAST